MEKYVRTSCIFERKAGRPCSVIIQSPKLSDWIGIRLNCGHDEIDPTADMYSVHVVGFHMPYLDVVAGAGRTDDSRQVITGTYWIATHRHSSLKHSHR